MLSFSQSSIFSFLLLDRIKDDLLSSVTKAGWHETSNVWSTFSRAFFKLGWALFPLSKAAQLKGGLSKPDVVSGHREQRPSYSHCPRVDPRLETFGVILTCLHHLLSIIHYTPSLRFFFVAESEFLFLLKTVPWHLCRKPRIPSVMLALSCLYLDFFSFHSVSFRTVVRIHRDSSKTVVIMAISEDVEAR